MTADKEDKFDEMLGRALRGSSEPVPAHFTDRMLRQIEEAEQQRILAQVVLQERLALAGCIALSIIAIVVAAVFPGIAGSGGPRGKLSFHILPLEYNLLHINSPQQLISTINTTVILLLNNLFSFSCPFNLYMVYLIILSLSSRCGSLGKLCQRKRVGPGISFL